MKPLKKKWAGILIGASVMFSAPAMAAIDCDGTAPWTDTMDKLNYALGEEGGIGLFPNARFTQIYSAHADKLNAAADALSAFQAACHIATGEDSIYGYFELFNFVIGKVNPFQGYLGGMINDLGDKVQEAGERVLNKKNWEPYATSSFINTGIRLRMRGGSCFMKEWCAFIEGEDLLSKVRSVRFIARSKSRSLYKVDPDAPIELTPDGSSLVLFKVTNYSTGDSGAPMGVFLDALFTGVTDNELWARILWNTGQVSLVPINKSFVKLDDSGITIQFANKKEIYELEYPN